MAKRTKVSKFRELYPVIEDLLTTYTQEGVVEILAERYDLTLTTGTLTSYLYQHRKKLSVATDNSNSELEVKYDTNEQNLTNSQGSESIQENNTDSDDDSDEPHTPEELDALLDEMKRKVANESNKSLFDR